MIGEKCMNIEKHGQFGPRFFVYIVGLLIMSLGVVLLIKSDLGATPWDVLHVGLYYQLGLTIGSWSITMGIVILTASAIISKAFPQFGAFLNMILVGVFIDMFFLLPFIQVPDSLVGKWIMFIAGVVINGYGMGIYISARFGAGPRDSLMIAVSEKTGWKVRNVRGIMEIIVLYFGWQLGGPIFWGTLLYGIVVGPLAGFCLPQCQRMTAWWLLKLRSTQKVIDINRGASK